MRSMLAGLRPVSSERKGMLGKQFSKGDGEKVVDIGRVGLPVTDVFWIFFFQSGTGAKRIGKVARTINFQSKVVKVEEKLAREKCGRPGKTNSGEN